MTDYGQFYDKNGNLNTTPYETKQGEAAPSKTCSSNSSLVKFVKHIDALRAVLKAASEDGFCLDELVEAGGGK